MAKEEAPKKEKLVTTFVARVAVYADNNGRIVEERNVIDGEPPEDYVRFLSRGSITVKFPMGTANKSFKIPLPRATTPVEAFAMIDEEFPAANKKAEAELRKEIQKQVAKAMQQEGGIALPSPNMLDGRGRLRDGPGNILGGPSDLRF